MTEDDDNGNMLHDVILDIEEYNMGNFEKKDGGA
jgi:hypothetical protein